ncbi:MAG TPA: hypothetical protein VHS28_00200, partial [Chloroflexota bacterium]|nr:hypothetical protein [Chloroflexota bacterium]
MCPAIGEVVITVLVVAAPWEAGHKRDAALARVTCPTSRFRWYNTTQHSALSTQHSAPRTRLRLGQELS